MGWRTHVVTTPDVLAGKPGVRGTRLGAEFLPGLVAAVAVLGLAHRAPGQGAPRQAVPAPGGLLRALTPGAPLGVQDGVTVPPPPITSNADRYWHAASPESAGVRAAVLRDHMALCASTGADACLVARGDRIVAEWYRTGVAAPPPAMSSTKSVTGLVAMALLADGKLRLETPVCHFVPPWCDRARRAVTVRHLLTMTSGLPSFGADSAVGLAPDADAFVSRLRPTAPPGTRWAYSNEGAQLLGPVLARAAATPLQAYARRRVLAPLGLGDTRFGTDRRGHALTYADLRTTPRDLARLGRLVLQHGRWGRRRILPAALVDSLVLPSQGLLPEYGMLWWRTRAGGRPVYAARGFRATSMYLLPDADLVVVRLQERAYPGDPHLAYERAALPLLAALVPPPRCTTDSPAPAHPHRTPSTC